jgi:C4-dicarboxylate transporter, DctM subunit
MLWFALGGSLFGAVLTGAALGAALGLTGFVILQFFAGGSTELAVLGVWNLMNSFTLSSVPMFILLGDILVISGLSSRIYGAVVPLFERVPGQLMQSNIAVCTLFGAVSGSSAATSAAVGSVAYRELAKRGYDRAATAASLAAGGTLGLLIPPSLSLLIFAAWQDVSVGRLFIAGILPGLMMSGLFMLFILYDSRRRPQVFPAPGPAMPLARKLLGLLDLWPMVILIGAVLGTIYLGLATPTEAAGLGVLAAVVLGFAVGELTPRKLMDAALTSIASFGALSFVLVGAVVLTQAVMVLGLPKQVADVATMFKLSKLEILAFVIVFYLIMGVFFDGISLMLTTVPFIYPLMVGAGFDPVWIGIFVTIMIEIGMLTPPIGVNLFVMVAITRQEVDLNSLSRECLPYWIMLLVGTVLLAIFPQIVLFLPDMLF